MAGKNPYEVMPLSRDRLEAFSALLQAEATLWKEKLYWDFTPTTSVIEAAVKINNLPGLIAMAGSDALGYIYWVKQREKAIVGSLFSRPGERNREIDLELLGKSLTRLFGDSTVRRIEGQLLYFGSAQLDDLLTQKGFTQYTRCQ
ncbi:hypothetical protein ACFLU6_05450 [Acidobacteriota bacterium]